MKKSLSIATVAAVAGYRSKSSGTGCPTVDTSGTLDVFGDGSCVSTFPLDGNTHNLKRIVDSKYFKTIYSNSPVPNDYFGVSCAIGSNFFLVGSYGDDDKGTNTGKVEMFSLDGTYIKTIYSNSPGYQDYFGYSCAIGSDFFLVGSHWDDDRAGDAGKVEMFSLDGTYIKTIYSNSPGNKDNFGISCAIGSDFFLVGSYGDDDKAGDAGKVEMFSLDGTYIKTIYGNSPANSDYFGSSCAIGSDFFLVGSYGDDDNGTNAGKVEMFSLDGTYIKTIYSNSPATSDAFGRSCAIGSDFFLVGSYLDDDKAGDAGKVEMFSLDGTYIKTIYGNSPVSYDYFGISCAIGSDFFLVGSHLDDDKGTDAGKVEMFAIVKEDMKDKYKEVVYVNTIYSSSPAVSDFFGISCAIGSSFFLIGSIYDDDRAGDAGKVEMFSLDGTYIKTIYGNSPAAGDQFGSSCAIGSDFFLVGSYYDDDKGTNAGKVEMFSLDGTYIKTIYSNSPAATDYFGVSCAIGPDFFLVGSHHGDDKGTDAGKVEMFSLDGTYIKTIYSNSPAVSDYFGYSCAIGNEFFLVGSYGDDDKASAAGKVEMFSLDGTYIKTIYSSSPAVNDYFGRSCAIGSNFFLVGSHVDDDKAGDVGKVEMFSLDGTYIKTIYSNSPAGSDQFGRSCAIGSDFFLVGSYADDDKATDAGKVEMFRLGDITTPLNVTYSTGKFDKAAIFNGINGQIISSNIPINGYQDFSISCWVNVDKTKQIHNQYNAGYFWHLGDVSASSMCGLALYNTGELVVQGYSDDWTVGTDIIPYNVWTNIVLTRTSNVYKLFVDGILKATDGTRSINLVSGLFKIGTGGSGQFIDGSVDQVRIFNKAFTSAEVSILYNEKKVQDSTVCDPYWSKTSLLLSGDGTNGSQSFTDLTGKNAIQTIGNAQISTSNKKFGTGSMYFDGDGDYLSIPVNSSNDLGIDGEPFTVEQWVYFSSFSSTSAYSFFSLCKGGGVGSWNGSTGHQYLLGFIYNNTLYSQNWNGSSYSSISVSNPFQLNTWYHYAVSYDGTTTRIYVNGALVVSSVITYSTISSPALVTIGVSPSIESTYFNGYIDDLRVTKGIARYTSNFTPPTKAFPTQGI